MIVFDLKINDKQAEKKLRKIVTENFRKFKSGVRPSKELEMKYEEKKY
jgi:hypothetical protein